MRAYIFDNLTLYPHDEKHINIRLDIYIDTLNWLGIWDIIFQDKHLTRMELTTDLPELSDSRLLGLT